MNQITPDAATLVRLRAEARPGPVTLLNLLAFKRPGGREAFARYGAISGPLIAEAGGEPVLVGEAGTVLAGEGGFDLVIAFRFPDVDRFVDMLESERYQRDAAPLRSLALERTLWMAVQPAGG